MVKLLLKLQKDKGSSGEFRQNETVRTEVMGVARGGLGVGALGPQSEN